MVTLQPLDTLGYDPTFFKLSNTSNTFAGFTYFTFDDVPPPGMANEWNIVGLRRYPGKPLLVDISLMYVGDDELSLSEFNPEYANNFLMLTPTQFRAIIMWFEENVMGHSIAADQDAILKYFRALQVDELLNLRPMPWQIQHPDLAYYCYSPHRDVQSPEIMSIIGLPIWLSEQSESKEGLIEFITFDKVLLNDPKFRPLDATKWLGYMTFDEETLQEFIMLLRQHMHVLFRDK